MVAWGWNAAHPDGQLLPSAHDFQMRNDEQGSRIGIVMNGSPLLPAKASSGESEIRRWMLENDCRGTVALPTDLYNTGIQTYVWLTNRKSKRATWHDPLIDASSERFWKPCGRVWVEAA
jgi:type I restriction enzyme M protein